MSSLRATTSPVTENAELQGLHLAHPWLPLALITILALVIRLAWLGSKSLWTDEAHSLYFASQSFTDIFSRLCDPHPPAYYALLRVFLTSGRSEFWLRLPSAIAGALTIPLLYVLGRDLGAAFHLRWLDQRTALLAALLLAVAPLHVWYSQEARMYVVVTALGVAIVFFALRVALRGRKRDALSYVILATAALYFDQASLVPLLLANLLWAGIWVWRRSQAEGASGHELLRWIGLQLIVGAAFWLWWSQALFRSAFEASTLYPLTMAMLVFQNAGLSMSLPTLRWVLAISAVIVLVAGMGTVWFLIERRRIRRIGPVFATMVVILFVLVTFASVVPRLFTLKRLVISLLPFFLLISAWAMRRLALKRWQLTALTLFSLALCGVNVLWIPKEPWREAVAAVQQKIGPNDTVWVDELAVPAYDYYYSGPYERLILRAADLGDVNQFGNGNQQGVAADGRIWVVAVADGYRNLMDYLPASWESVSSDDWHHVSVRAFAKAQTRPDSSVSNHELPSWLLGWPSPLHDACLESR